MDNKPKFDINYSEEAWEFLSRIDQKTREKIVDNANKARFTLDPKLLKKLTGGDIWEFRTLYNKKQYRMLAFWDKRDGKNVLVIVTHGFIKKSDKVPLKEIEKTKQIMKEYFQDA